MRLLRLLVLKADGSVLVHDDAGGHVRSAVERQPSSGLLTIQ